MRWTTNSIGRVSSKDIHMAEFCDQQALRFDEVMENTEEK